MATDFGWAIRRNGSCLLAKEVDCGATVNPYRACCPTSSNCPSQYNAACCPPNVNCTSSLVETPSCANSSWVMYDNGGYFCCEKGQVGYNISNTDGCGISGNALPGGAVPVAVVDQTFSSTSTSASASATTTTTATTEPTTSHPSFSTPSPNTSDTVPGGTIAGAVIGGLAGIATIIGLFWFILRKKKGSSASRGLQPFHEGSNGINHYDGACQHNGGNQFTAYSATPTTSRAEMDSTPPTAELLAVNLHEGRSEMP
ncbi:hypothetical protein F4823DRAFT_563361 [Ustulina deusta]|nr:hypothetical protein F4823DRAFT_563361 [Ustulina deusta]